MSEVAAVHPDSASAIARNSENVVVGDEIVRHRLSSRVMHWSVAVAFMVCLFTGMPIWTPIFSWMAALFGGLHVCRWLHPYAGVAFFVGCLWMAVHWMSQMALGPADKKWLK